MKKTLIFAVCILSLIIVTSIIHLGLHSKPKGGEDALTVFDVNSNQVTLTYNGKSTTLTGINQKKFVQCIKRIYNDNGDATTYNTDYDITINFNNGYTADISTTNKILSFDGNQKNMSGTDLKEILEYLR